ncbi:MAG: peptide deformylase [Candidatus Pacebacteria bacterium]|nr:peptide deformylase [Candidatus Paceibacterota bacterium]
MKFFFITEGIMILEIVKAGNSILRQQAKEVSDVLDPEIQKLIDDMEETLASEKKGVGLAAPQVGRSLRIISVKTADFTEVLINPVIVERHSLEKIAKERCLSIPSVEKKVRRSRKITVWYLTREGFELQLTLKDFSARVVQHEVDHLNGVLLTDK